MLFSRRMVHVAELGLSTGGYILAHPDFRIIVEVAPELVSDAALFARSFSVSWDAPRRDVMILPLSGAAILRSPGATRSLRRGELLLEDRRRGFLPRYERATVLIIEWNPDSLAGAGTRAGDWGPISRRALLRLRRLVGRFEEVRSGAVAGEELAASILAVLQAEGLPFETLEAADLREETPPWERALLQAVDTVLDELPQGPAILDLEDRLGWSRRKIQRRFAELHRRYRYHSSGWRDLLHRVRLSQGSTLLSAPGANAEMVARALGYGSGHALRTAFAQAGLPPPSEIPAALRRLG